MCFIDVPVTDSQTLYEGYATPFARVTFTVLLHRKPVYYVVNILFPSILFSILTIITLTLQPGSSDRLALGLYCHYCVINYSTRYFEISLLSFAFSTTPTESVKLSMMSEDKYHRPGRSISATRLEPITKHRA